MSDVISNPLLALLRDQQMLDDLQLEEINEELNRSGNPVMDIIKDYGYMDVNSMLQVVSGYLGAEVMQIDPSMVTDELKEMLPLDTAQAYQCVPVGLEDEMLKVAFVDPLDPSKIDELSYVVPLPLQTVLADPAQVTQCLNEAYGSGGSSSGIQIESGIADILSQMDAEADIDAAAVGEVVDASALDLNADEDDMPVVVERFVCVYPQG